jgi:hypothetical protein
VVRVEASHRAIDLRPGPQHRAVEVDGQAAQAKALDIVVDEVADQVGEPPPAEVP